MRLDEALNKLNEEKLEDEVFNEDELENETSENEFDEVDDSREFGDDYEPDERAEALANELGVDPREVENKGNNEYEVEGDTYKVLTDDEADDLFYDYIENFIDECGVEGFTPGFQEWIYENACDCSVLDDSLDEMNWSYVDDIESENDNEYDNRLISELVDNDLLSDDDFYTNRELIEQEIKDAEDVDESELDEVDHCYLRDEVDLDSKKQEYVDILNDVDDVVEYFKINFGEEEVTRFLKEYGNLDIDAIVDEVKSWDGRGPNLASYDGYELELDNGYFAYKN